MSDEELPAIGRVLLSAFLAGAAVGILAASAIAGALILAGLAVDRARAA